MKPKGRPPTGCAKSSTQRSREWRARQQARDRDTLAAVLKVLDNEKGETKWQMQTEE